MVQGTCMSGAFGGLHAGGVWGVRRDADKTQEADEQNGPRSRLPVLVFSPSPVGSSGDELKYDYFRDSPMVR